jgi:hypothetical protein
MPLPNLVNGSAYRALLGAFVAWKLFLFAVVFGSSLVGDTYDTSAGLVIQGGDGEEAGLVARLASWDAIYFVSIAHRGYRFEQDWAFGAGLPLAIRALLKGEFIRMNRPCSSAVRIIRNSLVWLPNTDLLAPLPNGHQASGFSEYRSLAGREEAFQKPLPAYSLPTRLTCSQPSCFTTLVN